MSSQATVVITPLVLLSVVDHYKRLHSSRVVGVLLGNRAGSKITVTNSFAIPFEELNEGFYLDTSYLSYMYELYCKVNCHERILGWYHSGPGMYKSDLDISKTFCQFCDDPVLAIINVKSEESRLPCQSFSLERNNLRYINTEISADEIEEVGVEHLLRDIKEGTGSSLKDRINEVHCSMVTYKKTLSTIIEYLDSVIETGKFDRIIMENLQDILLSIPKIEPSNEMEKIYSAELANSLVAMNDLERNRVENKMEL